MFSITQCSVFRDEWDSAKTASELQSCLWKFCNSPNCELFSTSSFQTVYFERCWRPCLPNRKL